MMVMVELHHVTAIRLGKGDCHFLAKHNNNPQRLYNWLIMGDHQPHAHPQLDR